MNATWEAVHNWYKELNEKQMSKDKLEFQWIPIRPYHDYSCYYMNEPRWVTELREKKKDWCIGTYTKNYPIDPSSLPMVDDMVKRGGSIQSVKRLSDNEVFSVGEHTEEGEIKMFEYQDSSGMIVYVKTIKAIGYHYPFKLSEINKKKKQFLFKTEDGRDVYEGDRYWLVNTSTYWGCL